MTDISVQGSYELGLQQLKDEIAARDREIERLKAITPDRFYEIEAWCSQLEAENARLRTALRNIAIGGIGESNWSTDEIRAYAEDAVAVE